MTLEQLIHLLNAHNTSKLTELQEFIIRSTWEGNTYEWMATQTHYGSAYIRRVGRQLWQQLSDFWQIPLDKSNLRLTLEPKILTKSQKELIANQSRSPIFPDGPLSLNSPFYISRSPIEELAYQQITEPGSVTRIKAPQKMGKSSLILRIVNYADSLGYHSVILDLQEADKTIFGNLFSFLRWFCLNVSQQLGLKNQIEDYWDQETGNKISCTIYFQHYILKKLDNPVVVVFNEMNRVFEYSDISEDFLSLLRYWHEQARSIDIWQKLRLVVSYSTEIYIPLNINQSPFNVGLHLEILPLTFPQIQQLAQCYQLQDLNKSELKQLLKLVGGHPYLIQLAFYHLSKKQLTLEELLEQAATNRGIYRDYLEKLLAILRENYELQMAFKKVINGATLKHIDSRIHYQLSRLGLINEDSTKIQPSCQLYGQYFKSVLETEIGINPQVIDQVLSRNKITVNLQDLIGVSVPLSLILCYLNNFQDIQSNYGQDVADNRLRQVISVILQDFKITQDLITRYQEHSLIILLPKVNAKGAVKIAENMVSKFENLEITPRLDNTTTLNCERSGDSDNMSIIFGIACTICETQEDIYTMISAADFAVYQAKMKREEEYLNMIAVSSVLNYGL